MAAIHVIVYGSGARAALAAVGATDVTGLSLIRPSPHDQRIEARRARPRDGVTCVAVDSPVRATDTLTSTTDPAPRSSPARHVTSGATAAWADGLSGEGIGVAVIDRGVIP